MKTLYKKDLNGHIRCWKLEVEGNSYCSHSWILGREDTSYQVTEPTFVEGKNTGKANATTAEEQALKVAESLYRIRYEQGFYDSVEDAGKGKNFFQPMLAHKYAPKTINYSDPVYCQPKLDGIRCIVNREGMWSRHGKRIISAPHIFEKLQPLFEKNPDLIFDGELYSHDLNNDFNKIISLARKSKPTKEDLIESAAMVQYWCYDLPSNPGTFEERNAELFKILVEDYHLKEDSSFVFVPTFRVGSDEEVDFYLMSFVSQGFEGAIVRLNSMYECKRSKSLLKVKKFEDEEFTIVDIEEGRGNLAGKAGRVIVDVNGKRVSAGLKFSHDDAAEIWTNKDQYIGKTATIRYFNVTKDGSLRFPKCIQIDRENYE